MRVRARTWDSAYAKLKGRIGKNKTITRMKKVKGSMRGQMYSYEAQVRAKKKRGRPRKS